MGFLALIWHNVGRNRRRSALTVLAICVSMSLYTFLTSTGATLDAIMEDANASLVLHVQSADAKSHRDSRLPENYGQRIARLEQVGAVTPLLMSLSEPAKGGGLIAAVGVDPDTYFLVNDQEIPGDEALNAAFAANESIALVGSKLAARYNWQTGGRVTITAAMGGGGRETFTVQILPPTGSLTDQSMTVHLGRLQSLTGLEGVVGMFEVRAESLDAVPLVMGRIDQCFAGEPVRTRTLPGMAYLVKFLAQLESIAQGLQLVALGAVVSTLLVAANSVAMSARERTREIGVLKALGFRRAQILGLIAGEALLLAWMGGLAGCLPAYLALLLQLVSLPGELGALQVEPVVLLKGLGLALSIGLLSGFLPALTAARLPIVVALRDIG